MDRQLALELKNAGFPQNLDGNRQMNGQPFKFHDHGSARECDDGCIYVPTLSELIEACGDAFESLQHTQGSSPTLDAQIFWTANCFKEGKLYSEDGSTPEEAVARLYIALNPTPKQ